MVIGKKLKTALVTGATLLLVNHSVNALRYDYKQHLVAGAGIGTVSYFIGPALEKLVFGETKIHPLLWGIGMSGLAGAGKELVYDWGMGQGEPEWEDFGCTVIGGVISSVASYAINIIIDGINEF